MKILSSWKSQSNIMHSKVDMSTKKVAFGQVLVQLAADAEVVQRYTHICFRVRGKAATAIFHPLNCISAAAVDDVKTDFFARKLQM